MVEGTIFQKGGHYLAHKAGKVFSYILLGLIATVGLLSLVTSRENIALSIFTTLCLLCIAMLILGLISPSIIPGKVRSRAKVTAIYLTGSILFFVAVGMVSNTTISTEVGNQPKPVTENKPTINKKEFNKIKTGMTYDQVKEIIGSDGEVKSEVGGKGEKDHTIVYVWKGVGAIGANATMTFQNGVLQAKAQFGLN